MRAVRGGSSWKQTPVRRGASLSGSRDGGFALISSVSASPGASTCPDARSALTDRLACLRGGGGEGGGGERGRRGEERGGTWMNGREKKKNHPPTGRRSAPVERSSSRHLGGGGGLLSAPPLRFYSPGIEGRPSPRLGPLDSLVLYSVSLQT